MEAVDGTVDKWGNIAIFPLMLGSMPHKQEALAHIVHSKEHFAGFAAAIREGVVPTNPGLGMRYHEFGENIMRMKNAYDRHHMMESYT